MYREYWNRWQTKTFGLFIEGDGSEGGGKEVVKDPPVKKDDEPSEAEIAELAQAKNLLAVFKDPASRKAFITQLAESEGISKDSTKTEIKEAKRSIKTLVKKHLGGDYDVLADRMDGLLTEFSEMFEEERVKPVKDSIQADRDERAQAEATKGYDAVFSQYTNSKELEEDVVKLCDAIRPAKGQSAESYFQRLLVIAAHEKGVTLTKKTPKDNVVTSFTSARRNVNRQDASSRIASEGVDDSKVVANPNKKSSLDEAIAAGAKAAEAMIKR